MQLRFPGDFGQTTTHNLFLDDEEIPYVNIHLKANRPLARFPRRILSYRNTHKTYQPLSETKRTYLTAKYLPFALRNHQDSRISNFSREKNSFRGKAVPAEPQQISFVINDLISTTFQMYNNNVYNLYDRN